MESWFSNFKNKNIFNSWKIKRTYFCAISFVDTGQSLMDGGLVLCYVFLLCDTVMYLFGFLV